MERRHRSRNNRFSRGSLVRTGVAFLLIAFIFLYALPRIVDYRDVWAAITAMTWLELLTLTLLALWNQVTYVLVEVAARPGLRYFQALKITQTSTAVANTLPAGAALGVGIQSAMYSSYGYTSSDTAISLTLTGAWNTMVKLSMPVVALGLLALKGQANGGLLTASAVGMAVFTATVLLSAVMLKSDRGASFVGRLLAPVLSVGARALRKEPKRDWPKAVCDFRRQAVALLRGVWIQLTIVTIVSHVSLYLLLLLTLRHVGIPNSVVSWEEALAAFAFVRLLSTVPLTPGGIGVVELGATATLVAAGGPEAMVVAAVLVYRFLTFVLPIPFGALMYVLWRHELIRLKAVPGV